MRFIERKRPQPPAVILVSLIDILLVLLIFLVVTTTFKQHPAIKITLPESSQSQEGKTENETIVVTLDRNPPHFYLAREPVSYEELQARLGALAAKNPLTTVAVRTDTDAAAGRFIRIVDAAKAAGFKKPVSIYVRKAPEPE